MACPGRSELIIAKWWVTTVVYHEDRATLARKKEGGKLLRAVLQPHTLTVVCVHLHMHAHMLERTHTQLKLSKNLYQT